MLHVTRLTNNTNGMAGEEVHFSFGLSPEGKDWQLVVFALYPPPQTYSFILTHLLVKFHLSFVFINNNIRYDHTMKMFIATSGYAQFKNLSSAFWEFVLSRDVTAQSLRFAQTRDWAVQSCDCSSLIRWLSFGLTICFPTHALHIVAMERCFLSIT